MCITVSVKTTWEGHLQLGKAPEPVNQSEARIGQPTNQWPHKNSHFSSQLVFIHVAILNNFHVLAISVAAMVQKLLLFLVSEIQPYPCLFTSNPKFGLAFLFPELSTFPDARGSSFALRSPNSKQRPVKVKLRFFIISD